MPNMSHCKFSNTLSDLEDCKYSLDTGDELSPDEAKARKALIELCSEIAREYGEGE